MQFRQANRGDKRAHALIFGALGLLLSTFILLATSAEVMAAANSCGTQGMPACDGEQRFPRKALGNPNYCPPGTQFDEAGRKSCWSCPSGYEYPTVDKIHAPGPCQKKRGEKRRGALLIRRPPRCPDSAYLDVQNGECFNCPTGFRRTMQPITGDQSCYNPDNRTFNKAELYGPPTCPQNGTNDPKTNECYKCAPGYERDEKKRIDSLDACFETLYIKVLANKISDATCPPSAEIRDGNTCFGCPAGAEFDSTTNQCVEQPCHSGLIVDENGLCQQPSAIKTKKEALEPPAGANSLPGDSDDGLGLPEADEGLPDADEVGLPEADEVGLPEADETGLPELDEVGQ